MGIISAAGQDLSGNLLSLQQGRSTIGPLRNFPSRYADRLPFGEIKISDETLRRQAGITAPGVTRTTLLAIPAMKEAISNAGLSESDLRSTRTAFINATTVGGMCLTDELGKDAHRKENGSEYLSSYDCASVTLFLMKYFGLTGISDTLNTACSSSANAILQGARLIRHGLADRAIVGGVDSLAKFTINGFNALHILSAEKSRPFDAGRNGLNLGEAAAFLVIENEKAAAGKKCFAVLSGSCNANDAYHPSSLSDTGDGPVLAMEGALKSAGLAPGDIQYINAHGTGTENNDLAESRAMERVFGTVPLFSSTKPYTGHTLGAAGAVEAVFSMLSIGQQEAYATLNFTTPMPDSTLVPLTRTTRMPMQHVMSNSFGFGGNCSALVFSAC